MITHRIYVGCIGEGVFRSLDQGETFRRAADGMFVECDVRALVVDPMRPEILYLGSEDGVFVTRDGADNWARLPASLDHLRVWALHVDPRRPGRILVGTGPARIHRTEDGGQNWVESRARMQPDCPRIRHTRVTGIVSDPDDPDRLWAGVEIDGIHHSRDGGKTWDRIGEGLTSADVHAIVVLPTSASAGHKRLLAATNRDLNISDDGGKTWRAANIDRVVPWLYNRTLKQKCGDPDLVFLGAGDGPPGSVGTIAISRDGGLTWSAATTTMANSTIWNFAVHEADPELIYAASVSGQVYRSEDGGRTWSKLPREFGEIRALAWAPG